jgi:phosphoserine aminotransferase
MISLLPGPSQITSETLHNLQAIATSGILSLSHRGPEVQSVCRSAIADLARSMRIPADYRILFTNSATAAMGVTLRSLVRKNCHHFVHGAFGARFHALALGLGLRATVTDADPHLALDWRPAQIDDHCELLALTHNETSTGSMWPTTEMIDLRAAYPSPLLVVDVTSSFGALAMDWSLADLWFCSVQKCLGLPAGLGILIAGPRALAVAGHLHELELPHRALPQESLSEMAQRMEDAQTFETPNVLAIALLARQMETWDLEQIEIETRNKASLLAAASLGLGPFVEDADWRSLTVQNLRFSEPDQMRQKAEAGGFLIGKGYGRLADTCLRIANFPASTVRQYQALIQTLQS